MGPMDGAKGIGHEDVRQVRQLLGELRIVGFLFLLEAGVLQQHDLPVLHISYALLGALPHGVGGELDPHLWQQLLETGGYGRQGVLHIHFAFGTAQMGAKDHLCIVIQQVLDGGHGGHDTLVVRHLHVLGQGHVEIHTAQHALSSDLNVFHCLFCHISFLLFTLL